MFPTIRSSKSAGLVNEPTPVHPLCVITMVGEVGVAPPLVYQLEVSA